jgi:hypothetical protein
MHVNGQTQIEELVEAYPKVAGWFTRRGLRCVVCGEPFWGTIEELAEDSGVRGERKEKLVEDLNDAITNGELSKG